MKGDEDVRLDALFILMMDGSDGEMPQLRRGLPAQIGAQQVVAFAPAPIVRENSAGASDP